MSLLNINLHSNPEVTNHNTIIIFTSEPCNADPNLLVVNGAIPNKQER